MLQNLWCSKVFCMLYCNFFHDLVHSWHVSVVSVHSGNFQSILKTFNDRTKSCAATG